MKRILVIAALALPVSLATGAAPSAVAAEDKTAPSASELFAHLAKGEGFSASFHEIKKIAFLKAPLTSSGRVYFAPAARFARHVDTPTRSSLYIEGNTLVVVDGDGKKRIDLAAAPAVKELLHSVLHLLGGKRQESAYQLEYSVNGASWQLRLTPKTESLRGILTKLEFAGVGRALGEMRLFEASGDSSVTTFRDVRHSRKFTAEEIKKYLTAPTG
jgi:outer membrane lipoprotein-sorting protein